MYHLDKKGKCGEGAYGVVYEANLTLKNTAESEKVAVKRNYGDSANKGISCIREMNFLASVIHPCVIRLKSISVGDPFENGKPWTPKPKRHRMKEDSHHFVMEFSDMDLDSFSEKCFNFHQLKTIMCQLLLGLEYIHSKGILHRDIKPPNILVTVNKNVPYAKYCDFGLSCVPNKYRPSTPGAVTSWYRSPEICCEYDDYSFPTDIWALACVFYEITTKRPFIQSKKDDDQVIFEDIITNHPTHFSMSELNTFMKKGDCNFKIITNKKKRSKTFIDLIKPHLDVRSFNKRGGNIIEFSDLLDKMFVLNPDKRITIQECLSHPFFKSFQTYIESMRTKYPPMTEIKREINIINCVERRWAANVFFSIYNNNKKHKWYSHDILFQAFQLFDRYLDHAFNEPNTVFITPIRAANGQLNTKFETELYAYTCVYIMYKYYNTLYKIYPWSSIFPKKYISDDNLNIIEEFEKYMIRKVTKYIIFNHSLIDILSKNYNIDTKNKDSLTIKNYMVNYGRVKEFKGCITTLYTDIKTFIEENENADE